MLHSVNELLMYWCKEDICVRYIRKSYSKDLPIDVFIFIMSKLRAVKLCFRFEKLIFHPLFFNVNVSITIEIRHLIFPVIIFDVCKEGTVSQIFYS